MPEQQELDEVDQAALAFVRRLFFGHVAFRLSAYEEAQLPQDEVLEIAFAGRSNVGKSSLINKLLNRQGMAKASREPGRTQALNLFELGEANPIFPLRIVDMPGYGYAKAPKQVVAGWTKLVENYLKGRVNLRRVLLLIDARHGMKPKDEAVLKLLDIAGVSTRIVLTKMDKISNNQALRMVKDIEILLQKHPSALPHALLTSADKNKGLEELRLDIAGLIN